MSDALDDISYIINIYYMCTYKSLVFGAKNYIHFAYQAHGLLLQMLSINILKH